MKRSRCIAVLCGLLMLGGRHAEAQKNDTKPSGGQHALEFDATGRLRPTPEADDYRRVAAFILVDKTDTPRCYVTTDSDVDLASLVNLEVGLIGSVLSMQDAPMPLIVVHEVEKIVAPSPRRTASRTVAGVSGGKTARDAGKDSGKKVRQAAHLQGDEDAEEMPPSVLSMPIDGDGEDFTAGPEPIDSPSGSCNGEGCGRVSCDECRPVCLANDPGQWFVRAEYLLWATKGMGIPPLATTGPSATNPGILGEPGTVILFGNQTINGDMRSGGRISFGKWLDPGQTWGLSAEYFGLADAGESFFAASDSSGVPTISRPYFTAYGIDASGNLKAPGENAELVALDDVLAGSLRVNTNTSFQGGGVFLRHTFCCCNRCWGSSSSSGGCTGNSCCDDACLDECTGGGVPGGVRVGMVGGYRYMQLGDGVSITEDLTSLSTVPGQQGNFLINDSFHSTNQFSGGELGFILEARRARWTMELLSRLAIGNNRQTVGIAGSSVISNSVSDNGTYEGGLLALPTNIGTYRRNVLSVIPQINLNVGYNLTPSLRAIVGYSFLYWGNVSRAGEQISLDVNETYIPRGFDTPQGPARPAFAWQQNDFWAQGVNMGVDYFW